MATDKKLRAALLAKLGVTRQRLSQRANDIKRRYGPMHTEDAIYLIAHLEGIDVSKYLDRETTTRVRSYYQGRTSNDVEAPRQRRIAASARSPMRPKMVRFPTERDHELPIAAATADDARRMALVYPKLYLLENSIRQVILETLRRAHGADWFAAKAPTDVKNKVIDRKALEKKKPWHSQRGAHEINYTDFGDLRKIIERNWDDFKSLFPTREWIVQKLDDLESPRNVVAHSNPLSQRDETRIGLHLSDWEALMKDRWQPSPDST